MAGEYHITIEQGATFARTLTWRDGSGSLVNLTGFTARMQVRRTVEDATVILELTTENSGITLGGAAGTITLSASATATAALDAKPAVYDLELVSSGGVVTRLLEGNVIISRNVTR
jgi:hypothetical protein